ncbi:hypothetical protein LX32DRAFT_439532 [Colletotrichum zoysiae]|uniref:Uncharacterized protein n=1 Tax=Colletotrichum zoysiae TaxID=1216348 RepID=A0AAD9HGE9_9PEZI|nr:hypothetical protein LX32DRAFT_439532 [Colletotrichum zoysiae]
MRYWQSNRYRNQHSKALLGKVPSDIRLRIILAFPPHIATHFVLGLQSCDAAQTWIALTGHTSGSISSDCGRAFSASFRGYASPRGCTFAKEREAVIWHGSHARIIQYRHPETFAFKGFALVASLTAWFPFNSFPAVLINDSFEQAVYNGPWAFYRKKSGGLGSSGHRTIVVSLSTRSNKPCWDAQGFSTSPHQVLRGTLESRRGY